VDLALAIPIIIPCPYVHAVTDSGMGCMAAPVALPFVRVQDGAAPGEILGHQGMAGALIRVVTDPQALLACVARREMILMMGGRSFA
jgi:hypothetical protein